MFRQQAFRSLYLLPRTFQKAYLASEGSVPHLMLLIIFTILHKHLGGPTSMNKLLSLVKAIMCMCTIPYVLIASLFVLNFCFTFNIVILISFLVMLFSYTYFVFIFILSVGYAFGIIFLFTLDAYLYFFHFFFLFYSFFVWFND